MPPPSRRPDSKESPVGLTPGLGSTNFRSLAPFLKSAYVVAILASLYFPVLYALSWPIGERGGELSVIGLFVLGLPLPPISLGACLFIMLRRRQDGWLRVAPLLISGGLLGSIFLSMNFDAKPRIDFRINRTARQEVVDEITSDNLPAPEPRDNIVLGNARAVALPQSYRGVTWSRGTIVTYEVSGASHVVFIATHGIFQEFTGWVYRSDDAPPALPEHALHGSNFRRVRQLAPHWFWVEYG